MSFSDRIGSIEQWLRRELGRPVPIDGDARRRIMERVRASARPSAHPSTASRPHGGRTRIVYASPWIGSALAAGLAALVATGSLPPLAGRGESLAAGPPTIGDTVAGTIADTIVDTLRVVRFFLSAPTAARVSLVGDFNRWDIRAMPLRADERGAWWGSIPLPPGWHRYAFVVDDTQWIADPSAEPGEARDGRRTARVHVSVPLR